MRIQIDVSESRMECIKKIMEDLEITTYKEFFSNALAVLDWVLTEKLCGRSVTSVDANGTSRILVIAGIDAKIGVLQRTHKQSEI